MTEAIIELAKQYRRYGYRRTTALLHFVSYWTQDGRSVRLLTLIDEYTRTSLAVLPRRR